MNKKNTTGSRVKRKTRLKKSLWIWIIVLFSLFLASHFFFQSGFSLSFFRQISSKPNSHKPDALLFLVDQNHPCSEQKSMELKGLYHGKISVDERAFEPLVTLLAESSKQGIHLKLAGGYRSSQVQQMLFDQSARNEQAKTEGLQDYCDQTLPPESSEHQSGLAVDLVPVSAPSFDPGQNSRLEYRWLQAHCMDYGFILRYPPGKEKSTRHPSNPWHYRYVGLPAAREIMQADLCLKEYLEQS